MGRFSAVLLILAALFITACAAGRPEGTNAAANAANAAQSTAQAQADDPNDADISKSTAPDTNASAPKNIGTVVSLAPSITRTLIGLGLEEKIIGCDTNSAGIEGLKKDIPQFDMMAPDVEKLIELNPDIVLASSLSFYEKGDGYKPLGDAGIVVAEIPTAQTIADIKTDIAYIAGIFGAEDAGRRMLSDFDAKLDGFKNTAAAIPEDQKKSVYFEISAAPDMYTTGGGTYLNEMIELIGAKNIFSDKQGWMPVSGEAVAAADPDAVFTNVDYIQNPVAEILSRKGWAGVKAVTDKAVYQIDKDSSAEPNQDIVTAMEEMAKALYPEYY